MATPKNTDYAHVLVQKKLHRRLKVLSAEIGIPMIDLTTQGLVWVIDYHTAGDKQINKNLTEENRA